MAGRRASASASVRSAGPCRRSLPARSPRSSRHARGRTTRPELARIGQGTAVGERVPIDEAEDRCSASASSMIGRPGTSRSGSRRRPARSFPKTSRPACPRGLSPGGAGPVPRGGVAPGTRFPPLPYLDSDRNRTSGCFDIVLEVPLGTTRQREAGRLPRRVSVTNFRHQPRTVAQMIAHHTVNDCNSRIGDVIGSGTVSGPGEGRRGAIQLSKAGNVPVPLATGEERAFLEDGDTVTLSGYCARMVSIGSALATAPARSCPRSCYRSRPRRSRYVVVSGTAMIVAHGRMSLVRQRRQGR